MSDLDIVFFACPANLVKAHAATLREDGIAVFDITGSLIEEVGFSLHGVANNEQYFSEHRLCVLPSPIGAALSRVYYSLQGLGACSLQASMFLSASTFGTQGTNELSQQVSSLFMGKEPIKRIFPSGLAFDILPIVGQIDLDGGSSAERRVELEVASLMGINPQLVRSTLNLSPIFSGLAGNLTISFDQEVDLQSVTQELSDSSKIVFHNVPPSVRTIIGYSDVNVGRVRPNVLARGIDLWLCADNVSTTVHNVLEMAHYYHSIELI